MSPSTVAQPATRRTAWFQTTAPSERPALSADVAALIGDSYPRNHNYRIKAGRLAPSCRLAVRFKRTAALYPQPLTSLLDLSASKGYFVLEAAQRPDCERALGIDAVQDTLAAASAVRDHLGLDNARFACLRLDALARKIGEFGGPFQTVLLINTYQYLYFGSDQSPWHFTTHREIFSAMRQVCTGRVIFHNRLELADCQTAVRKQAALSGRGATFSPAAIRAAAEEFFTIEVRGRLGRRPFWLMTPR